MLKLEATLVRSLRIACNAFKDLRYGGILASPLNSDYTALAYIFENRIKPADVLVDIGCGKGRVINFWLSLGLPNQLIGIELDEKIAGQTRQRLRRHKNVTILSGDAIQNIPAHGTLFYLFNPFEEPFIEAFKNCLIRRVSYDNNFRILYYNCKHLHIFQRDPKWLVEVTQVGNLSVAPFNQLAVIRPRHPGEVTV